MLVHIIDSILAECNGVSTCDLAMTPGSSGGRTPDSHIEIVDVDRDLAANKKRRMEANESESPEKRTRVNSNEHWNNMLHRLTLFHQQYGHCNVPKRYPADPQLYVSEDFSLFIPTHLQCQHIHCLTLTCGFPYTSSLQWNMGRYTKS